MLSYEITQTGYVLLRDGVPFLSQTFDRAAEGYQPFADDAAKDAAAQAHLLELQGGAA